MTVIYYAARLPRAYADGRHDTGTPAKDIMAGSTSSGDPHAEPADTLTLHTVGPAETAVVREENVGFDTIETLFDRVFGALPPVIAASDVDFAGAPHAIYTRMADDGSDFDVEIGFPVTSRFGPDVEEAGVRVSAGSLPGGEVARLTHFGGYDGLPKSWERLVTGIDESGRTMGGPVWEVYLSDPAETADPAELRTDIFALLAPEG